LLFLKLVKERLQLFSFRLKRDLFDHGIA
jgi:hypothetical protein